jgi:hypothetical protein
MKRWFYIAALALAVIPFETAYSWVRTYGTGMGYSVRQTTDGGYIISGNGSDEIGNLALILIKTDEVGEVEWREHYIFAHGGYCVQETSDGGYIVVGSTHTGDTGEDLLLMKTDEHGDTLWTRSYGYDWEDAGNWVEQTSDGGYIVTGHYIEAYLWLLKTNESGYKVWEKLYDWGPGSQAGSCVRETGDGGYIVTCGGGCSKPMPMVTACG